MAVNWHKAYVGVGSMTATDISSDFESRNALQQLLTTNCMEVGLLAKKPYKGESKVEKDTTTHYTFELSRTTNFSLTLNGLSQATKAWWEAQSQQNTPLTLIMVNKDLSKVALVNGKSWTVEWSLESGALWSITVSTEFMGLSDDAFALFSDLPEVV